MRLRNCTFNPPRLQRLWLAVAAASLVLAGCLGESPESLRDAGRKELERKDARAAVINFKNALRAEPTHVEGRFLLGRAYLESGDPAAAMSELNRTLDQKYDPNLVLPLLSKAMLQSGEHKKLTQLYNELELSQKPAQAALKSNLATAWGVLGDRAKTEASVAAALAAVPDFPTARMLQVRLVAGRGEYDEALKLIDQTLLQHARSTEAWHLRGELLAFVKGDEEGAVEAFRKVLSVDRANVLGHVGLINSHIRTGKLDEARKQADALRELLPRHPQLLFADAELAFAAKDFKKARENTQLLLRGAPNNTVLLVMAGAIEAQSGALLQAQSFFAKALQLDTKLRLARVNLARVNLKLGQPAKALETVQGLVGPDQDDVEALSVAGDAALQMGENRVAEAYFARAAKSKPGDERIDTALALTQLARGDDSRGFSQLESLQRHSRDSYVDMALVSERLKRGQFDAALAAVDAMLAKHPNMSSTHELRGRVLLAKRDFAGAKAAYEKALSLEPGLFSAVSSLALVDSLEGKPEQAQARMREAIKANPRNVVAYLTLAEMRTRQGAPTEELRQLFADAIKAAPTDPAPRLQLVGLLFNRRMSKEALAAAQEAAAALPSDPAVLDALGRAQASSNDALQAITTFRKVASLDPTSAGPHLRMADVQLAGGKSAEALASLRKALELEPHQESVRSKMVEALVNAGRVREAVEMAREIQKRLPTEAGGYLLEAAVHRKVKNSTDEAAAYRLGLTQAKGKDKEELSTPYLEHLFRSQKVAEAEQFAATWLKQNPDDGGVHLLLGDAAMRRSELPAAEAHFKRAIEIKPRNALALNNLAWVLAAQGKPGSVALAQRASELVPNLAAILDTLAFALASEKQYVKAMETVRMAMDMAPSDNTIRLTLARIAVQSGDKQLARLELDRLAAMGARLSFQSEVQRLMAQL